MQLRYNLDQQIPSYPYGLANQKLDENIQYRFADVF